MIVRQHSAFISLLQLNQQLLIPLFFANIFQRRLRFDPLHIFEAKGNALLQVFQRLLSLLLQGVVHRPAFVNTRFLRVEAFTFFQCRFGCCVLVGFGVGQADTRIKPVQVGRRRRGGFG